MLKGKELKSALQDVHTSVFPLFSYVTDEQKHGLQEKWEAIPEDFKLVAFTGDCEDFAQMCRRVCIAMELDTRLVVCYDETGAGHCVLESGGYILDNRYRKVVTKKSLEKEGYKWVAISGFKPGDPWHKVEES